jgi:hypothetical protein
MAFLKVERVSSNLNATAFVPVTEQMLSASKRGAAVVTSDEPRDTMLVQCDDDSTGAWPVPLTVDQLSRHRVVERHIVALNEGPRIDWRELEEDRRPVRGQPLAADDRRVGDAKHDEQAAEDESGPHASALRGL